MTAQEFKRDRRADAQGIGFTSDLLGYSRINLADDRHGDVERVARAAAVVSRPR